MSGHTVPPRTYFIVFAALMVLYVLTVAVAFFDWGAFADVIAMLIAMGKTSLVVLYFMHVRYSSHLTWIFAGAGVVWLIILFSFTLSDYLTRHWLPA